VNPTTGVDELIFGTILIAAGTLVLYFRQAVTRMSVRHYGRMADLFPWLYAGRLLRAMKGEPFLRWLTVFAGLVLVANGIGFIVWGVIWGWG
jgi:hypothetical protein